MLREGTEKKNKTDGLISITSNIIADYIYKFSGRKFSELFKNLKVNFSVSHKLLVDALDSYFVKYDKSIGLME